MPNIPVDYLMPPLYDLLWRVAIPVLRKNNRLADGFAQRILKQPHLVRMPWLG